MSVIESHKAPYNSLIVQFLIDQLLINEDNKEHTHILEARKNNRLSGGMSGGRGRKGRVGNCNGHL